jgi:FMN phosphatase YigB (HAD superfamily)
VNPAYRAVLWDFDGTLVRRPDMWCTSIAEACLLAGAPGVKPADFDGWAHVHLPWNTSRLSHPHADSPDAWWCSFLAKVEPLVAGRVGRGVDVQAVLRMVRTLALAPDRYEVIARSAAAVDRTGARGIPQYVLSNHVPELGSIVSRLFPGRFRQVWTSGRIGFEKPRPEIFRHALDRLPFGPEAVLMVGDDACRDLEPARRLGMDVLHVGEVDLL